MSLSAAVRAVRRRPAVALAAILSLATGIGAATAIFSIVSGALLRPLPWPDGASLAAVINQWGDTERGRISPAEAFDYAETLQTVRHLGVYADGEVTITGGAAPERLRASYVSSGVLPALDVAPRLGRWFTEEEDLPGGNPVAIVSHATWQSRLGGGNVVGTSVVIDGVAVTIVGVMPRGFRLPQDVVENEETSVYLPLRLDPGERAARGSHFLLGIARLRDGVSTEQASAEVARLASSFMTSFPAQYPREDAFRAFMMPVRQAIWGDVRPLLLLLLAAVLILLLIACANVTNLMLVSADARRRDLAVRTAIGAGRRHLLGQFALESLVITLPGAALGLGLAVALIRLFPRLLPPDLPAPQVSIDGRVLLFTAGVGTFATLLTAILPVFQSRDVDAQEALREEGRSSTGGRRRARFRSTLIAVEMALAVILSLGAGLLLRTMGNLQAVDPGFRGDGVLTMRISLPEARYENDARVVEAVRRIREELGSMRGVTSAGAVTNLPLGSRLGDLNIQIEGRETRDDESSRRSDWQVVTPGYFETLRMPIVRGRGIEPTDRADTPGVVVINQALANLYWNGTDPVGTRFRLGGGAGPGVVTVVGIVGDIRHGGLTQAPRPEMYLPHAQFRFWNGGSAVRTMSFTIRGEGNPRDLVAEARAALGRIDPDLPLAGVRSLSEVRAASLAGPRFVAALFSAFSALAVLMAAIGIYGLIAFLTTQRTREIGIRMALGAGGGEVMRLVLRDAMRLAIPGIAIGAVAAFALSDLLGSQLHGVAPRDPVTFAAVIGVLLLVAGAASLLPARRAARVEPTEALRQE